MAFKRASRQRNLSLQHMQNVNDKYISATWSSRPAGIKRKMIGLI